MNATLFFSSTLFTLFVELDTTVVSTGVSAKAKAVYEVSVAAARAIELNDGVG